MLSQSYLLTPSLNGNFKTNSKFRGCFSQLRSFCFYVYIKLIMVPKSVVFFPLILLQPKAFLACWDYYLPEGEKQQQQQTPKTICN